MGAGWVAGSVRGRLLAHHRLGAEAARAVATAGSFAAAREQLRASPYVDVSAHAETVAAAQHAIWAGVVWNLRVLAGWLPAAGVETTRVLAAFLELRNIEDLLFGAGEARAFDLGTLATAWTRARDVAAPSEVRGVLRQSAWRDPGSDDPDEMLTSLRLEWARRLGELDPAWGGGAAALVVARMVAQRKGPAGPDVARRAPMLGPSAATAPTVSELSAVVPDSARWVLREIADAHDLWRAEARWWRRLDDDAEAWLRAARPGMRVVLGAVTSLMVDAWRVSAAIEIAARGGRGREVLDAVA